MNFSLFKMTVKNNWKLWMIFTFITLGYLMMIISMYNEESMEYLQASLDMVPAGLAAAVGMDKIPLNLPDFVANYFYGFLVQLFLLVHVIILPLRLVVKEVDNGSMAFLMLNFTTFLLALAMASIVFFSCILDISINAVILGAGILLLFFVMSLVGRYGHFQGFYGVLSNLSIFRFLQAREIISGEINMLVNNLSLIGISILFLGGGVLRFTKRNLSL